MNRKPIFDAVRAMLDRPFSQREVDALDAAIERGLAAPEAAAPLPTAAPVRSLGTAGAMLIRKWEGCARALPDGTFAAYPDPGSADGQPWTIGWGSTGPDVHRGVVWTQAQCDARFDVDIASYVAQVAAFVDEAPTTQNQFDALVSFHYNTGALRSSTLGRLHRQGRFAEAQDEFGKWIYNDHKPMNGLKARRADEAELYGAG
ncbi:MAG TPA: lysozyme [Novosphingobium sp.]|nr:lysozyme [Novosphingobium sp.]